MIVAVPKHERLGEGFSKLEKVLAMRAPGRRTAISGYQSPATWITELVSRRKLIILCSFCRVKFNPRKHNYRRVFVPDITGKTDGYQVNGDCDSCKQDTALVPGGGTAFQSEEDYAKTHIDPTAARRAARAAAGMVSPWQAVKRMIAGTY